MKLNIVLSGREENRSVSFGIFQCSIRKCLSSKTKTEINLAYIPSLHPYFNLSLALLVSYDTKNICNDQTSILFSHQCRGGTPVKANGISTLSFNLESFNEKNYFQL